jgi:alpha-methylacyl-CoA racemase
MPHQMDRSRWDQVRARFAEIFASRTRQEWMRVFDGTDACVAPVLGLGEAAGHPHNQARRTFVDGIGGAPMPAPAPRLSRTPGQAAASAPVPGTDTDAVLGELGMSAAEIAELRGAGAVG